MIAHAFPLFHVCAPAWRTKRFGRGAGLVLFARTGNVAVHREVIAFIRVLPADSGFEAERSAVLKPQPHGLAIPRVAQSWSGTLAPSAVRPGCAPSGAIPSPSG